MMKNHTDLTVQRLQLYGILNNNSQLASADTQRRNVMTTMYIRDLLTDPTFNGLVLLAGGDGDQNSITSVTVVDTPDGAKWLNGGEFVITTGYMVGNDTDSLLHFLRTLHLHKVSGLGIKANRHIDTIHESVLRLANELRLPLIAIPEHYSFVDIINPVLTRIVNRQYAQLSLNNVIHNEFQNLAINDSTIPEILQTLSLIVGIPSVFLDTYFNEIYYSDGNDDLARSMQGINPREISKETLDQYDCHVVAKQNIKYGYILFFKGALKASPENCFQTAVEQAGTILILRMQTRISNQYVVEKYKGIFMEDILLNNIKEEAEIHNRAHLYNWDFHNGGAAVVVDINNLKENFTEKLDSRTNQILEQLTEDIFSLSIQEMKIAFPSAKYMKQSDLIAFIVSAPKSQRSDLAPRLKGIFRTIQEKLKQITSFTITIGVGDYYENIRDIYKSYTEARISINLGYALRWFDRILFYRDMGLYRMLTPIIDSPEAKEFCERYLKPLEDYDQQNGRQLMATLQEIVQSGWNLKKASENMYLHYNSMKYRYSKICSVMNVDFDDHANRLMTEIAMIVHMMNSRQLPDTKQYIRRPEKA